MAGNLVPTSGFKSVDLGKDVPIVVDVGPNAKGKLIVRTIHSVNGVAPRQKRVKKAYRLKTFLTPGKSAAGHVVDWDMSRKFDFVKLTTPEGHADIFVHMTHTPSSMRRGVKEGRPFEFIVGADKEGRLRAHPQKFIDVT